MNELKRMIEQMVAGARADTDMMFDSYRKNLDQLDRDLAAAEGLLVQAMTAIKAQRQRIYDVMQPTPQSMPRIVQHGPKKEQSNG